MFICGGGDTFIIYRHETDTTSTTIYPTIYPDGALWRSMVMVAVSIYGDGVRADGVLWCLVSIYGDGVRADGVRADGVLWCLVSIYGDGVLWRCLL